MFTSIKQLSLQFFDHSNLLRHLLTMDREISVLIFMRALRSRENVMYEAGFTDYFVGNLPWQLSFAGTVISFHNRLWGSDEQYVKIRLFWDFGDVFQVCVSMIDCRHGAPAGARHNDDDRRTLVPAFSWGRP